MSRFKDAYSDYKLTPEISRIQNTYTNQYMEQPKLNDLRACHKLRYQNGMPELRRKHIDEEVL